MRFRSAVSASSERQPLTLGEYALSLYIITAYLFTADAQRVWISNFAGIIATAAAILTIVQRSSLRLNTVVLSRVAFVVVCAFAAPGRTGWEVPVLTAARIALMMAVIVIVSSAVRSIRAVEFGSFCGTGILLLNAYRETGLLIPSHRYGNLLGNANGYAFALLVTSFFAVRRLLFSRSSRKHTVLKVVLLLMLLASAEQIVLATGSRKGLLCLALLAAFILVTTVWLRDPRQARRIVLIVGPATAVVFVMIAFSPYLLRFQGVGDVLSGRSTDDPSDAARAGMANSAVELWLRRPLLGWGLDEFRYLAGFRGYSHSNIAELLADCGLLGLTIYYVGQASVLVNIMRVWRRTQSSEAHLELAWAAFTTLSLLLWGIAAVQWNEKLDAAALAALSVMPNLVARQAQCSDRPATVPAMKGTECMARCIS